MNRKQFLLGISIGLLFLSGYFFHSAYQLWSRYQEAVDYFRHLSIPPFPTGSYPYIVYTENYANFFVPYIIEGVVSSIIALTLIIYLMGKLSKKIALTITVGALVVWSMHSFYNAYQLWMRYQEATQSFLKSISFPNVLYIENFENFFILSIIKGAVSLMIASTLFLHRKTQTST